LYVGEDGIDPSCDWFPEGPLHNTLLEASLFYNKERAIDIRYNFAFEFIRHIFTSLHSQSLHKTLPSNFLTAISTTTKNPITHQYL
jgi:hypothetical protein